MILRCEEGSKLIMPCKPLVEGHFLLSGGEHSLVYFEKFIVYIRMEVVEQICSLMVTFFSEHNVEVIATTAIGGIVLASETARQMNVPWTMTEKYNNEMVFKRYGFTKLIEGHRVGIIEDVVTLGGSLKSCLKAVKNARGIVECLSIMVDRSSGRLQNVIGAIPAQTIIELDIPTYQSVIDCPGCQGKKQLSIPGRSST